MIHDINGRLLFGAEIDSRTACFGSTPSYPPWAVNRLLNPVGLVLFYARQARHACRCPMIGVPNNGVMAELGAADKFRFALSAPWMESGRPSGAEPEGRETSRAAAVSS